MLCNAYDDMSNFSARSKHQRCYIDLTKKANPCLRNEEHKQEQERSQPKCRCMINLTSWGLTNRRTAKLFFDRII